VPPICNASARPTESTSPSSFAGRVCRGIGIQKDALRRKQEIADFFEPEILLPLLSARTSMDCPRPARLCSNRATNKKLAPMKGHRMNMKSASLVVLATLAFLIIPALRAQQAGGPGLIISK
jgi:hypothetical protein